MWIMLLCIILIWYIVLINVVWKYTSGYENIIQPEAEDSSWKVWKDKLEYFFFISICKSYNVEHCYYLERCYWNKDI